MKIIDSHLHLDIVHDIAIMEYMRHNLLAVVIWAYCEPQPTTFAELSAYYERQAAFAVNCTAKGLPCFRLAGIHPRNIPTAESASQEKVDKLLTSQLGQVYGIGEIGLEKGTNAEKEILAMQIDFARRHCLKACIHTPRKNKNVMMLPMLEIVEKSGIPKENVLIDHLDSIKLVKEVVNMGCYVGITISPAKSKLMDVLSMLRENNGKFNQIMLNSDLAVPDLTGYELYVESVKALPPEYNCVAAQTALNFFGMKL